MRIYRVGRWLDRPGGGKALGLAMFAAIALPVATILEPDGLISRQGVLIAALWLVGILLLYAFWRFKRQERLEHRRAYRFTEYDPNDDLQVIELKRVVLARETLDTEREAAVQHLLARGALTPYRPNLALDVLVWVAAFVFVGLAFLLIVWVF